MKLILQIELNDWKERAFANPLFSLAKSIHQQIVVADLDQDSEGSTTENIIQLIETSTEILLIVNAQPYIKLGASAAVFYKLIKSQKKVKQVCWQGSNLFAEKMMQVFNDRLSTYNKAEENQDIIQQFCKT
jgi:hypothetical protein